MGTTGTATYTYNIAGKILMTGSTQLFTPITVTMYHECNAYTIAATATPIVIDYTD